MVTQSKPRKAQKPSRKRVKKLCHIPSEFFQNEFQHRIRRLPQQSRVPQAVTSTSEAPQEAAGIDFDEYPHDERVAEDMTFATVQSSLDTAASNEKKTIRQQDSLSTAHLHHGLLVNPAHQALLSHSHDALLSHWNSQQGEFGYLGRPYAIWNHDVQGSGQTYLAAYNSPYEAPNLGTHPLTSARAPLHDHEITLRVDARHNQHTSKGYQSEFTAQPPSSFDQTLTHSPQSSSVPEWYGDPNANGISMLYNDRRVE
ncbi:hypothetical protein CVT26_015893 [Gymnopilus dilepis]|uniref:Uncharacterized protein n=1 Tax=Gymnopilus dilepis TaxID=231916 RepID=A0A409XYE8_9AGAR|nr:hypothetical protein CVT26_015893 [Gymnopilus dilepis]